MSYYALYLSKISLTNVTYFSPGVICLFMEIYDYCLLVRHVIQCFTCHSVKSRVIGNESSCSVLNSLKSGHLMFAGCVKRNSWVQEFLSD